MLVWINDDQALPPTRLALGPGSEAPGLLAAGGRVTPERLEEAYRRGVFPWYSPGQPVLWWSPDPRMVLRTEDFHLSHSLRKTLRRFIRTTGCEVRIDSRLTQVIHACATTPREGQDGTWIVPAVMQAYVDWHRAGRVHSIETWIDNQLVGGLYFVALGRMFFGESMFAHRPDASKIALAALVGFARTHGVAMIDCQQNTGHLASLGAREVSRDAFERQLTLTSGATDIPDWTYDSAMWGQVLS
jgi:leucyl/phenylalanyl-tRNA--protein transferase